MFRARIDSSMQPISLLWTNVPTRDSCPDGSLRRGAVELSRAVCLGSDASARATLGTVPRLVVCALLRDRSTLGSTDRTAQTAVRIAPSGCKFLGG